MRTVFALPVAIVLFAGASLALAGDCVCKAAKSDNGWCKDCSVGYVSGVKLESQKLYAALEGMEVKKDDVKCAGCKTAMAAGNGECSACHLMFENGVAYKSAVAADLAAGKHMTQSADDIKCAGCKKAALAGHGWCDHCNGGIVGHQWMTEKDQYEAAVAAHGTLVKASKAAGKCEGCAIAMVTDGTCEHCNVSFKNGELAKAP